MGAFNDDELERYFRLIEERTAAREEPPRRHLHRRLVDEPVGCPTPSKTAFRTRAEASAAITSRSVGTWRTTSLRTYRCQCGWWHLTSRVGYNDSD